jgi:diguanylate cyclase (GGDEF)-like protein
VRLLVTLLLGLGVGASALLASLKGRKHGEQWAFYAFLLLGLDGLSQMLEPLGWPAWPLLALAVASLAVAEGPALALTAAALVAVLRVADAARGGFLDWKPALAAALGYPALVLALQAAQRFQSRRLKAALDEIDRLRFGSDVGDPGDGSLRSVGTTRLLRDVSEEGRRALKQERAGELQAMLADVVAAARVSLKAHAVLLFDVDRERDVARLRTWDGADVRDPDAAIPLSQDPFAFVLGRGTPFYATDFPRLLHELPYYKPGTRLGTLLAVPVRATPPVVSAVLIADRAEIQGFTGDEPETLEKFATLAASAVVHTRAAVGREEEGREFHAVYRVSEKLAQAFEPITLWETFLRHVSDLVEFTGAAFVVTDERQTHYRVVAAQGWAPEFKDRAVALTERTWTAWVLRGREESLLIEDLAGHKEKMPVLVLDEDMGRVESLLIVPLKIGLGEEDAQAVPPGHGAADPARQVAPRAKIIGAWVLTGAKGAFDAAARRVLGLFANQGAATLYHIRLQQKEKTHAARDGLTGLYNRRAFDERLQEIRAAEERLANGRFALLILDLDHFKKLNDTYGHPAGDAALKNTARALQKVIRGADIAARYGGEEFALIMPNTEEEGARKTADRIRHAIEQDQLVFEAARIQVTASIGVACWPRHAKDAKGLVAAADRALYAAKQAGRNRVVSASELPDDGSLQADGAGGAGASR